MNIELLHLLRPACIIFVLLAIFYGFRAEHFSRRLMRNGNVKDAAKADMYLWRCIGCIVAAIIIFLKLLANE